MLTINIAPAQKLLATHKKHLSAFVSFQYDLEIITKLKQLPRREYLADSKQWEIPLLSVPKLLASLPNCEAEIKGEMQKQHTLKALLPADFNFKTQPFNHQLEGMLFGLTNDSFLLGDEQGLGKTKQIIDLAIARKLRGEIKRCLIVCCVNSNKYNWQEEIKVHSNEKSWILGTRYRKNGKMYEGTAEDRLADLNNLSDHFFLITNIESLRLMKKTEKIPGRKTKKVTFPIAEKIQQLCKAGEISLIAVDEIHKCKNPGADQTQALLKTSPKFAIPMSGTFLVNNPLDLYVPLKYAGYENHSFYSYQQHFCVFGGWGNTEVTGYKNLNEIRDLLSTAMVRRTKDEVLDLPEKLHTTEYVEMNTKQKKVYQEVLLKLRENVDLIRHSKMPLAEMIRLRQATAYPGIISSSITESSKMDRMVDLVTDLALTGQKTIVFSQWEKVTSVAKSKLSKFNPAYIVGETKVEDRMSEVDRFQKDPDCKVIIGTIGAMGTGLTLNKASNVIFLDEPWNRAIKDQAEDRAHRIGTSGTVTVITLVCKDTIDEVISSIVYKKGKLSDMIVDGKATREFNIELTNTILSLEG